MTALCMHKSYEKQNLSVEMMHSTEISVLTSLSETKHMIEKRRESKTFPSLTFAANLAFKGTLNLFSVHDKQE